MHKSNNRQSRLTFKNHIFLCVVLFLSACQSPCPQDFQKIHSFEQVDFDSIPKTALVVFDVDETLIQPTDTYLMNEHSPQAAQFREQLFAAHPHIEDWDALASIILLQADRPLLEPEIISKVEALKSRGVWVIVCTAMNVGAYGRIPDLEEWRYRHLRSLGFKTSDRDRIIKFKGFQHNPGFYKGVLSTDRGEKGAVVGAYLDQMHFTPARIVMFDDDRGFLQSVKVESHKRGIPFQGFLYKGWKAKPWNQKVIQFQADYLIQNQEWVNDQEAIEQLR